MTSVDHDPKTYSPRLEPESMPRPASIPYNERQLHLGETLDIPYGPSLYNPNEVEEFAGFRAEVPLIIKAADKELMLLDVRSYPVARSGARVVKLDGKHQMSVAADFLLVSPEEFDVTGNSDTGYKGVRLGQDLHFGRSDEKIKRRFDLSSRKVSREHFILNTGFYGMQITDLSMNGTSVISPASRPEATRTIRAEDRMRERDDYTPPRGQDFYGYYGKHHIIGRNSKRIAGGVYVGGSAREAIVVDPEEDVTLDATYRKLQRSLSGRGAARKLLRRFGDNDSTRSQLRTVLDVVQSVMNYDEAAVDQMASHYRNDEKINLGEFIKAGVGVCRHQGLLAAYLVERLVADGKLQGKVSIQRNTVRDQYGNEDTHAWAAFTDASGREFVIDPAQSFTGTKQEARQGQRWDYYLPLQQ